MRAVADASALVAIAAGEELPLLDVLFDAIEVPAAVFAEVVVPGRNAADTLAAYLRDKVRQVDPQYLITGLTALGPGEVEAMALCKQINADLLLVDDARARRVARLNGIRVSGSIGVFLRAKQRGLIDAIGPTLDRVQAAGIYYSESLIAEALRLAGER